MRGNTNSNSVLRTIRPGHVLWGNRALGAILADLPETRLAKGASDLL